MTFPRTLRLHCTIAALAGACLVIFARTASAQAFLPPGGEGNVTIAYQNLFTRGHLDLNGERMTGESGRDPTETHSITWEAEYGLSNRLAVNTSIPYIRSKYGGSMPHRVMGVGPPQEWDDGEYHGTFQDFRVAVRYNITSRPLALTPFVEAIVPSHHYPSLAHAAVGKDLHALVVGAAAGKFLDRLAPGLFFTTQYSYTRTEAIVGIRPNRSRVDAEVGYFVTPRLALRFLESYQVTHDGFDLISFKPMTNALFHSDGTEIPSAYRRYHDQLQRANFLNLGGGVGFALNDSVEIFAAAAKTVWGESVHPLRGLSVGANVHFRTRSRSGPGSSHQAQRRLPEWATPPGDVRRRLGSI